MSIKVMSYIWDITQFKGSDKLIMLCLADHADDAGLCWPSIETIARKSGVSSTTAKVTLKKLEAEGWIVKRNQFKKAESGRLVRSNNQYQLPVKRLKQTADEQTDFEQADLVCSKFEHSKDEQTNLPEGVGQISAGGRADFGHKPSIDPLLDPSRGDLPQVNTASDPMLDPVVFEIPLKGKHVLHPVTQSQLVEWCSLYPAVDVTQQLRNMIGWCQANPTRQKTAQGIPRFIHAWLCKEQDKGRVVFASQAAPKPIDDVQLLKRKIQQIEIEINNENAALIAFQQRKSTASLHAAQSAERKIKTMMDQRTSWLRELSMRAND
ncbi:helix-turn-helix domain-containing protein [Vibrio misgurnus]|uniref:helix-turn-helix domain-containing protein n=1 Tax=Vibrio misgurnus TaxID=2993714 RepID=UPI0023FA2D8A|nr:helix-turn-helix domain-containing protein [Vibrio sp. VCS]